MDDAPTTALARLDAAERELAQVEQERRALAEALEVQRQVVATRPVQRTRPASSWWLMLGGVAAAGGLLAIFGDQLRSAAQLLGYTGGMVIAGLLHTGYRARRGHALVIPTRRNGLEVHREPDGVRACALGAPCAELSLAPWRIDLALPDGRVRTATVTLVEHTLGVVEHTRRLARMPREQRDRLLARLLVAALLRLERAGATPADLPHRLLKETREALFRLGLALVALDDVVLSRPTDAR